MMDNLKKVSYETMKFMRGKYRLDEIGDGKDELKFKQGQKTIVTIYIHEDKFTFLIILGKKEREIFEARRNEFSQYIQEYYDSSRTYHDGKWMFIDVTSPEQLEEIKQLIIIKKKPNRKPFPQEGAVYAKCGHRCDLCIHYTSISEEQRDMLGVHLKNMWGVSDYSMRCGGCDSDCCYCTEEPCHPKPCAAEKGHSACVECEEYPCMMATVADNRSFIHTDVYHADDITWMILPFVPWQYEK